MTLSCAKYCRNYKRLALTLELAIETFRGEFKPGKPSLLEGRAVKFWFGRWQMAALYSINRVAIEGARFFCAI
ncbi:MAG: hypothetical protein AMJ60_00775 [Desulfobacterales bacterium SG8_35]|nr:MAG: hypothetical protein AMJ60_00775 [Desulfobacterales bacterium SG8_35]